MLETPNDADVDDFYPLYPICSLNQEPRPMLPDKVPQNCRKDTEWTTPALHSQLATNQPKKDMKRRAKLFLQLNAIEQHVSLIW